MKKPTASLSSGLVAVKGAASPVSDMPQRSPSPSPPSSEAIPINFKMPAEFVRDFKMYAASHGLKLNEVFALAFDAYRKANP